MEYGDERDYRNDEVIISNQKEAKAFEIEYLKAIDRMKSPDRPHPFDIK